MFDKEKTASPQCILMAAVFEIMSSLTFWLTREF